MPKVKILFAGIGGVGGYFGGMMAEFYKNSPEVEIYFLARGKHMEKIRNNGLKLISSGQEFNVFPTGISDDPGELGLMDYIFLATKSYDLEVVLRQISSCVSDNSLIIPLLNGVHHDQTIKMYYPSVSNVNACVYILAQIQRTGEVWNHGAIQKMIVGQEGMAGERLVKLYSILKEAKLDIQLSTSITKDVWEKFYLVGANSTATSYFNCNKAELFADDYKLNYLRNLLEELDALAKRKNIYFDKNMIEDTIQKLNAMPGETSSSMHRDFLKRGHATELESITGYVVRESKVLNMESPYFEQAYLNLKERMLK